MERALEIKPDSPGLWWYLGDLYNRAKRYNDAMGAASKELELTPESAAAYCVWGKALEKQGRFEEAGAKFRQAVSCGDPTWHDYATKEIERQQKLIERREALKQQEEYEEE
jgi:tetratricopeptide (TPR) repeat protein